MRTITCLFFAVATLMLGNIRAGVGQPSDALAPVAALAFVIAAVVFAVLDWRGLPTVDLADRAAGYKSTRGPDSETTGDIGKR
jgi:hypothetical protein